MDKIDVLIIGASAAGLMCAIEAGKRKRRVLVLDHTNKAGKKILMSGGGRCNFTNYHIHPDKYISHNPHFCKSALARYTQWNFIELVDRYKIPYHEKTLGQLFCNNKSKDILDMLLTECESNKAVIQLNTSIAKIVKQPGLGFIVHSNKGIFHCESLVIATGGLSIPTMGASPFGYKVAEQFGIHVWPTRAGLVPLTLHQADKEKFAPLAGISFVSKVSNTKQSFDENSLFTHRGISGPAILQISSYWNPGEAITINTLPKINLAEQLQVWQKQQPQKQLKTILQTVLPSRMIEVFVHPELANRKLVDISRQVFHELRTQFNAWQLKPNGTEGYRTAEVTIGGVDCDVLSSQTMMVNDLPGLYFIGEVVDVTGWLGGYNFQWAWSSGWAAGQVA
jgi:predicted Rossmann fold flavoprotein